MKVVSLCEGMLHAYTLTHSYWETCKGVIGSVDPDQMPHHVASDKGLHCLLTGFSIKNRITNRIFHQKQNKSDKIDLTPIK